MRRDKRRRASPEAVGVVALFVTCGDAVFAIDSTQVLRMSLIDEVEVVVPPGIAPLSAGVVVLDGVALPAWDLAALLTGGTETAAWVVVYQDTDRRRGYALRTGRCACVRALPPCVPLPRSLTRGATRALRGAFRTEGIAELAGHPCGYQLVPEALLGEAELAEARELARRGSIAW